ncbi:Universal stress protein family protein [Blastococcus aurantiacus]|uniref:Universal stress protein family protein n=1 Tax=Blastococcus aurantiacus TaxID=1550231 RepID=A0A1G7NRU3_9ACTN|nr:universal stress protein [Blastococcus aurantiacus]SDF75970.1 Universal stress protein family protein [Blastococcus aurantiacus]
MSRPAPYAHAEPTPHARPQEDLRADDGEGARGAPPTSRRRAPWVLVEVDGSAEAHRALVWALREAARREATVVAVSVLHAPEDDPLKGTARMPRRTQQASRDHLEALVLRAVAETGITGRTRTAILERPVFEALDAAMHGADLVMVGTGGKRLLRPALPRQPLRRVARGA